ncbi:ABC transporter substrate-binding protein [Frigidibacter sp. ROC022]|uniref:ABC transporter substrate-binding protein n=1 Tax=Frigidibacter sp. ROC022 TaxID=2971796 RepID=UPI00215A53DF|nr:substrate-binding domain-containing protein [Frigidibacter sp. ROC022]MCR8725092.1 substrate-binding domain-containing protein [Frigidibacter sp. ROC022]
MSGFMGKIGGSAKAILFAALMASPTLAVSQAASPEVEAWLKAAELGPYAPEAENWDAIVEKAKEEGEVVIYSASGRIAELVEPFNALYPEIKVSVFDLGSVKTVEKTIREQEAGIYNADIVTTGNSGVVINEMLAGGMIYNYVPQAYVDRIPEENREPLLVRINEAIVIYYNTEANPDGPPISNIWELTEPEYKGRVAIIDPMTSGSTFMGVATIVQHADEMAAAYKRYAGKDIELTDGVPDAGYEFFARLLANDLVIFKSGSKLVEATGTPGQEKPLIGFAYMTYISKNQSDGFVNAIFTDLDPASKWVYPTFTAIAARAPHPNAAKLMTAYLLGSLELNKDTVLTPPFKEGKSMELLQGLAPYYDPGSVSPRSDVPLPPGGEIWDEMKGWTVSADFMQSEGPKLRDFWLLFSSL